MKISTTIIILCVIVSSFSVSSELLSITGLLGGLLGGSSSSSSSSTSSSSSSSSTSTGGGSGPIIDIDLGPISLELYLAIGDQTNRNLFLDWTHQYNKTYTTAEFQKRYKLFVSNLLFVNNYATLNPNSQMILGTNEFADLSLQEFVDIRLTKFNMSEITDDLFNQNQPDNQTSSSSSSSSPPSSRQILTTGPIFLSWKEFGLVTPVKNQGSCGSCYAFSAVGAVETLYLRTYGTQQSIDLSEQELVDCRDYNNIGCGGGWMHNAFKQILIEKGITLSSIIPYVGSRDYINCYKGFKKTKISKYTMVPRTEDGLREALMETAVSAAFDASSREFQLYQSGIFSSPTCEKLAPTHAVLVVGYYPTYWVIKNSWGTQWGEQGFFKMARNTNDQCGIARYASYPTQIHE
ncbi:hypothetical protein DFA_07161 [Cavenderia fasciculata]|uniref:Uncharacterized protein n=1 Tax=Cavenderia fasciculata TaxID=261658 RepID=F4PVN0_CACFS|nr:uncharacterized protein DFA_07161 [Cavenderia fasciculata]EGG20044.1 hypothetical protein DFA_07161 [Cavenderia fasciculata]|eukprot:XP_004367027.1 hypothetical protein DFA_07161 [Cavenderia fasciculata]